MASAPGGSAPPTSDSSAPWSGLLGLQPLPSDGTAGADLSTPTPLPAAASTTPPPPTASPQAPPLPSLPHTRVEGVPTARDRAYTYILQLPVTRVRQLCRDAKLKQFGRKDQSQPRLFWGTAALVEAATEGTSDEKWAAALPGLSAWLAAPHREHSTPWYIAPPPSARPDNFHTFYAHQYPSRSTPTAGATAAVRAALAGVSTPPPGSATGRPGAATTPVQPAAQLSEEAPNGTSVTPRPGAAAREDVIAASATSALARGADDTVGRAAASASSAEVGPAFIPSAETPQFRDRAYTYVTSLPVTAIRQICKRLNLKQFGRKSESQARLFWYWEDIASHSANLTETEIPNPLPGRDVLPGFDEWLGSESLPPGKWVRAPPVSTRPPTSPGKRRESLGSRRKRFTLNELARVVCALVHTPATRSQLTRVAALTHGNEIPVREFWITAIEPLFNDPNFVPQCDLRDVDAGALPIMHRSGEELRRHFEEAKPLFAVAYRKWQDAKVHASLFDSFLGDGKLSALERRAGVLFNVLRCGREEEYSDVLTAILRQKPEVPAQHSAVAPSGPKPGRPSGTRSSAVPIAPAVGIERTDPAEPELAPVVYAEPMSLAPEPPLAVDVEVAGTGATAEPDTANGMPDEPCSSGSVLGKRPRACCEKTAEEVRALSRRIDEALVPVAKLQSQLLKMQKEKALVDAIIARRTLHKDLVGESDPASMSLRAANEAALAQLTKENENANPM